MVQWTFQHPRIRVPDDIGFSDWIRAVEFSSGQAVAGRRAGSKERGY
jgi:hypothetical protein